MEESNEQQNGQYEYLPPIKATEEDDYEYLPPVKVKQKDSKEPKEDSEYEFLPPVSKDYGPTKQQLGAYGPTQEQLGIRSETAPKGPTLEQLHAPITVPNIPSPEVEGLTIPKAPEPVDQGLIGQGLKKLGLKPPETLTKAAEGLRDSADWMLEGMESGPGRVIRGAEEAFDFKSKPLDKRLSGGANMIEGAMETLRPMAPAIAQQALQTPIRVGAELATGYYGPDLFEEHVAKPLGLKPGATELGRAVVGAAPVARSVQRGMGALAERVVPKDTLVAEALTKRGPGVKAEPVPGPEPRVEPGNPLVAEPELSGVQVSDLKPGESFKVPSGSVTVTKVSPKGWIDFEVTGPEGSLGQASLKPKKFAEWIQSGADTTGLKLRKAKGISEEILAPKVEEVPKSEVPNPNEILKESAAESPMESPEALEAQLEALKQENAKLVNGGKSAISRIPLEKPQVSQSRIDTQSGKLTVPSRQELVKSLDDLSTSITAAVKLKAEALARGYHKFNNDWLNENHILWQLQKLEKEINLSPEESIAVGAESFSGQTGKVLEFLYRTRDAMKPYLDIWDDAAEYGKMERHAERGSVLVTAKDGSIIPYKLEGGITLAENARRMAEFNRSRTPQERQRVKQALDIYRNFHAELFEMLRDGGLISEDFYKKSKQYNEYYMPFHRLKYVMKELDKTGGGDKIKTGSSAFNMPKSDFAHVAKGSEKEILDPMQGLIRNAYRTFYAVERNRVASLLVDYAKRGNPGVILLQDPDTGMHLANVPEGWDAISYLRNGKKRQVAVQKDVAVAMKKLNTEQLDTVTRALNFQSRMLRAGVTLSPLFQMTNMPRDFFTAASVIGLDPITWASGFIGAMARDIPTDFLPKWMEDMGISNKMYRSFLKSGGSFGGAFQQSSLPETAKTIVGGKAFKIGKKEFGPKLGPTGYALMEPFQNPITAPFKAPFRAAHYLGETAELTTRLAAFKHAKKGMAKSKLGRGIQKATGVSYPDKPLSDFDAGWVARNATVNFAVRGAMMKAVSAALPFFNAGLQGSRITLGNAARNKKLTALRAGLYIGLPTLMTTLNNQINYADEYKDLDPEFLRDNLVIIYGKGRDKETGLPNQVKSVRMDGTTAALYNALRSGLDGWKENDLASWIKAIGQLVNDMSPIKFLREGKFSPNALGASIAPPAATAMYSVLAGKDLYTGKDLTAKRGINKGASPSEQYTLDAKTPMVNTSQALKKYMGLEISPHVLENVPRNLFGHLGTDAVRSMPSIGGKPWTNELRVDPFNRIRYLQPPERGGIRAMEQEKDNRQANIYRNLQIRLKGSKDLGEFLNKGMMETYHEMKLKYPNEPAGQLLTDITNISKRLAQGKLKGLTPIEQDLDFKSNEIKAQYILQQMEKDPKALAKLASRWKAVGLWGKDLSKVLQLEMEKKEQLRAAPMKK